jgi:ABC-type uncharacterized transport system substrate-binding protein
MIKQLGLAAALVVGGSLPAAAHPHVWVDVASQILFDEQGRIVGVRHHWRFDEFFSAYAVQGLDADGDGVLTREELQPLAQVNVESLSEFGFFTAVSVGQYDAGFGEPSDYWLEHENGVLTLHFTLPDVQRLITDWLNWPRQFRPLLIVIRSVGRTQEAVLVQNIIFVQRKVCYGFEIAA